MNPLDSYLQRNVPAVMVPRYGALAPLERTGHRFLVGATDVKLEIRRPWLHAIVTVAAASGPELPYGRCPPDGVTLTCGPVPRRLLAEFVHAARANSPKEIQGWIVWHEQQQDFELQMLDAISASAAHITYRRPQLPAGSWLVMDIHSHGEARAFFSSTDDLDDQGEVKLAAVVGKVGNEQFSLAARAVLLGHFVPVNNIGIGEPCTN